MRLRSLMPKLDGATTWLNGEVRREDLVGQKPTIIHFWSVSCHLCKQEMGNLLTFLNRYNNVLNVISVHMPLSNKDQNIEVIKRVAKQFNMKHPIYIDNSMKLTKIFENEYVPAYYLFDKSGKLRHLQIGGNALKMLERRINRLLDEM